MAKYTVIVSERTTYAVDAESIEEAAAEIENFMRSRVSLRAKRIHHEVFDVEVDGPS